MVPFCGVRIRNTLGENTLWEIVKADDFRELSFISSESSQRAQQELLGEKSEMTI